MQSAELACRAAVPHASRAWKHFLKGNSWSNTGLFACTFMLRTHAGLFLVSDHIQSQMLCP